MQQALNCPTFLRILTVSTVVLKLINELNHPKPQKLDHLFTLNIKFVNLLNT